MRKSVFFAVLLMISGCDRFENRVLRRPFVVNGPAGQEAVIYKIPDANQKDTKTYIAHAKVTTGVEVQLEPGLYYISNECSGYEFQHKADGSSSIPLSNFSLTLTSDKVNIRTPIFAVSSPTDTAKNKKGKTPKKVETPVPEAVDSAELSEAEPIVSYVHTECVDPLDGHRSTWENRTEFLFFPGTTSFHVGGRTVAVENSAEKREKHTINLSQLVVAAEGKNSRTDLRYFVTPDDVSENSGALVVYSPINTGLWLLPGSYSLEVNGSRRKLRLDKNSRTRMLMGTIRIETPPNFPMDERLKDGGQPIFAYVNDRVLFNLNTDYLVFPGQYSVSLEDSDVTSVVPVEASKNSVVKTLAARVKIPPCPSRFKKCKSAPKVTIHREQRPFVLMSVDADLPFLVFDDGKSEFGVEGTRGVLHDLPASKTGVHTETLARVKFKWEMRPASAHIRTDLVRFESSGGSGFGRSLDFLFSKPDEIYIPAGQYLLTYFVGDPSQERVKTRVPVTLAQGETREVIVPLYTDKAKLAESGDSQKSGRASGTGKEGEGNGEEGEIPGNLSPIRK